MIKLCASWPGPQCRHCPSIARTRRQGLFLQTKTFNTGRIRRAVYDPATQQLDLHWDSKTIQAYKQVPAEVWRRLCSAPNPTTYWEDRIAEEYPKTTPMKAAGDAAAGGKSLRDLLGGMDDKY